MRAARRALAERRTHRPRQFGGKLVNVAAAINDQGQVVGSSDLPGDRTNAAFLWTKATGMQNIGTLGTDKSGLPGPLGGINNVGQVVGQSCSGYGGTGNCRAFLWQNNVMTDLNTLTPADSPLYLVVGFGINDAGAIAGLGVTGTGQLHAFLATPQRGQ
jgi:probable HAF family extracellular repeat protein